MANGTSRNNLLHSRLVLEKIQPFWNVIKDTSIITFGLFCLLWQVVLLSVLFGVEISTDTIISISYFICALIPFLLVGFVLIEILRKEKKTESKDSFIFQNRLTILRGWGMLFRTLFITAMGMIAYLWFKPQSLGDIPFSQLTLNQVFDNLFGILIPLGCIFWFFKFPKHKDSGEPYENKYAMWGLLGIVIIAGGFLLLFMGGMALKALQ